MSALTASPALRQADGNRWWGIWVRLHDAPSWSPAVASRDHWFKGQGSTSCGRAHYWRTGVNDSRPGYLDALAFT